MTAEQELEVVQQLKESGEKMATLRKEYAEFKQQKVFNLFHKLSSESDWTWANMIAWEAFKCGKGYQSPKIPKVDA